MEGVILGLDLSLTGAGMVALPLDWQGDWGRVAHGLVGEKLPKDASESRRIGRLKLVTEAIIDFAQWHHCTTAIVEQYAFTSVHSHAHALGELGGVVKHQLSERLGLIVEAVPPASARKLILGKLPREKVKDAVIVALTKMGMPLEWNADEADAFVCTNWAASALGAFALVVPAPIEEKKPRRRKAA